MTPREKLNLFLRDNARRPFAVGEWDCLIFTNAAFEAMHGRGYADDWLGRYHEDGAFLGKDALQKEFGFKTLRAGLNARMKRVKGLPPCGALVITKGRSVFGHALGIANGTRAAFLQDDGIVQVNIDQITGAWTMKGRT